MATAPSSSGTMDKLKSMALGVGAPMPIPDVPGSQAPRGVESLSASAQQRKRNQPVKLTRSARRAIGIALLACGLLLILLLRNNGTAWIGGAAVALLGAVVLVFRRGA